MKYISVILFSILSLVYFTASAQREGEVDYEKEYVVGVNFNTNGGLIGGFMFRYSRLLFESNKQLHNFGFDLGIVKHPKEIRFASSQTGGSFIAFKTNHLVVLRPSYGREFILFRKGNEDGVQLDFLLDAGLSFGLLTPYYIQYQYGATSRYEAFDPDIHTDPNSILGTSSYFTGFWQSKVVPGLHVKTGFSFEYGHFTSNVTGMEVGFLFEAFTQKMNMMENYDHTFINKQFFSSVYINIYYGGRQ